MAPAGHKLDMHEKKSVFYALCKQERSCGDPDGGSRGSGPPPPPDNHKSIGFSSNAGLDPLENHKATKPEHSMLGHHRLARETPSK